MQLVPLMNDSKWDEVRLAMYALDPTPRWRTRDVENGYESNWDREWFYHFRIGGYETIEWVEIETQTKAERNTVLEALRKIHVPGKETEYGFVIFGYTHPRLTVQYL